VIDFAPYVPQAGLAATLRYKLRTARRLAAETADLQRCEGLASAARHVSVVAGQLLRWYHPARVWRRHRTSAFDRRFGVDTSGFVHPGGFAHLAADGADPHHYKAIRPEVFHRALASLSIRHQDYEFIDYGSGKGRALLLASDYPFRRITGIEFSPELHQVAVNNISRYHSTARRCDVIRSVCRDAAACDPPDVPCVLFFYDPFGERLMSAVLERIGASLARFPRELYVVYCQPRLRELLNTCRFLEGVCGGEHFAVYRSTSSAVDSR